MRIPDVYKGLNALEGYPPEPQTSAPLIQFFNGEDLEFEGYLNYDEKAVTSEDWLIYAVVKSSTFGKNIIWEGKVSDGIYTEAARPGYYKIIIPSSHMSDFASGTFWLDIVIKEQLGRTNNLRDRTILLSRIPFSYDSTASSVRITDTRNTSERTYPLPTNITKL